MRSRYSAYALGHTEHLLRTWHPRTRPSMLTLEPRQRWTGLTILATEGGAEADEEGSVQFRATWRDDHGAHDLVERSRFVRRAGRWFYLDGESGEE